ncbi:MAG: MltA domain-containing protein [Thermodesulfobacteriota bacterium]
MKIKGLIPLIVWLFFAVPGSVCAASDCCVTGDGGNLEISRDDLGGAGLAEAIGASLRFLQHQPAARVYRFCDREYGARELADSLTDFLTFAGQKFQAGQFERQFKERFDICAASSPEGDGKVLVTGYFEPLLEGSLRKEAPFIYPLYGKPDDLLELDDRIGRRQDGQFLPYWTRAQIENEEVLSGREVVFLDDPVEAFILHVQGSGRIRLRDGKIRRIQFAAKNGLPYRSIGKLLVERGKMELTEVSLPAIVSYLKSHPEERKDILQYNQSFIFFRWGDNEAPGPLGSLGAPLTAGRSVALDHSCFPSGALGFLQTRKPIFNEANDIIGWAPLRRFVVNQDSGSAIKGERRVDLFLGAGKQARATAGLMKHPGKLYFLVAKK